MNDGLKDKHREAIIKILSQCERIEKAVLFGSRAMGTFTTTSDVDIVLFGEELTLTNQARLAEQIEELTMAQSVDLLLYRTIESKELKKHIKQHGVQWWPEKNNSKGWAMENNWSPVSFSDAVNLNPTVKLTKGEEYPFVDMKSVDPAWREVTFSELRAFKSGGAKFIPKDTLMARITPCLENGKIARYLPVGKKGEAFGSTEFIVIRGKDGVTDNDFAYYLTMWPEFRDFAISQMTGSSGRQRVPVDSLAGFNFNLPPLTEQKAIAHILGSLDDKIELNRRMNETLEAMAQALFKSWFIDFDPVIDNILLNNRDQNQPSPPAPLPRVEGSSSEENVLSWDDERIFNGIPDELRERAEVRRAILGQNRPSPPTPLPEVEGSKRSLSPFGRGGGEGLPDHNNSSPSGRGGGEGLPDHIRQLFPSEFEYTEEMGPACAGASADRWIPKGWKVSTVGEEVEIVGGGTPSTKDESYWTLGMHAFCTPKDMSTLPTKVLLNTERLLTNKGVAKVSSGQLPSGTVLMSSRAPIGYLAIADVPVTVNQGIIAMLKQERLSELFLLCWASCNMDKIMARANGSTFLEISKKNFRPIPFLLPEDDIRKAFNSQTDAITKRLISCTRNMKELSAIRDTLLPQLLSGEIRIPEAEKLVEEAGIMRDEL